LPNEARAEIAARHRAVLESIEEKHKRKARDYHGPGFLTDWREIPLEGAGAEGMARSFGRKKLTELRISYRRVFSLRDLQEDEPYKADGGSVEKLGAPGACETQLAARENHACRKSLIPFVKTTPSCANEAGLGGGAMKWICKHLLGLHFGYIDDSVEAGCPRKY